MANIVDLPRLSDTMEEGVVAKWRIAVGDRVKRGQVIAEIETDKATMEFESFDAGIVLALLAPEGQTLPIGAPIAVFGVAGEDPAAALAERKHGKAPLATAPAAPASAAAAPSIAPNVGAAANLITESPEGHRIAASPIARRIAREHGLPLTAIAGSGPHGRIVKADVEGVLAAPVSSSPAPVASPEVDSLGRAYVSRPDRSIPLSQMRKAVARRMTQSKQEIPHFYLTIDIDMERVAVMRAEMNEADPANKVSLNDFVLIAAAQALRQHPRCNACFTANGIIERGDVHLGVAVALEDGLIVPVVRFADQKRLHSIASEVRDLGARARTKALRPEEMTGSSFTVSNLGMFGVEGFAAVVNTGEGGILAVGAVELRAAVVDGAVVARRRMKATMSCDHRVIDGAVGAQWLATLRDLLEHPLRLFA